MQIEFQIKREKYGIIMKVCGKINVRMAFFSKDSGIKRLLSLN